MTQRPAAQLAPRILQDHQVLPGIDFQLVQNRLDLGHVGVEEARIFNEAALAADELDLLFGDVPLGVGPDVTVLLRRQQGLAVGLDLSPMVVILALYFVDWFVVSSLRDLALGLDERAAVAAHDQAGDHLAHASGGA